MSGDTDEMVVNGIKDPEHTPRNRFISKFSKSQFRVLIAVVVCGVLGGAFLFVNAATTSSSLWPNNPIPKTITTTSSNSVELGVKFRSSNSGLVTGIRFYKGAQNTGTHIGSLWDNKGDLLASVTFKNETSSGWQTASFAQPINIAANVEYVASYLAPNGHYSENAHYFSGYSHSKGPLKAFENRGKYGSNGVWANASSPVFPTVGMAGANFWVDLVFSTKLVTPPTAPAPPTAVTATQSGSSIVVKWNAAISANPVASYVIIRNGSTVSTVGGSVLSFTDSNVAAGQTYSYQIETIDNTNAKSVASVTATATYNVVPPPVCPVGDTGTPPNCVAPAPPPPPPSGVVGPVTSLHYTANGNFDSSGNYSPGAFGFNLADISSAGDLSELPSGVKALAYIGLCNGADSTFTATIQPYIGKSQVYGFYLMDEPSLSSCPPANLKAESAWIHTNDPGTKTFIIMSNLSSSKSPSFVGSYNPTNSGLDLIGLDPYPCRTELNACDNSYITLAVNAAEAAGVPQADIVPVYQTFGGGTETDDGGGYWQLPTAAQENSLLATWKASTPTPAFDYAYSWGTQFGDQALSGSTALQQVFKVQNAQ